MIRKLIRVPGYYISSDRLSPNVTFTFPELNEVYLKIFQGRCSRFILSLKAQSSPQL